MLVSPHCLIMLLKKKLAAVSAKARTTRTQVRGIVNRTTSQIVFLDTPGIHKPVSALGRSSNKTAYTAIYDVDLNCLVVDALAPFGKGDLFVANKMEPEKSIVILNKIDNAKRHKVEAQLLALAELDFSAYFPVSAKTGQGIDVLLEYIEEQMPVGKPYYDIDFSEDLLVSEEYGNLPKPFWIAEMVREQIYNLLYDDMPYSVATQVVEYEWPYIKCEILVERKSQRPIVLGKGGKILREISQKVKAQLPEGALLELFVKVDKNWQSKSQEI